MSTAIYDFAIFLARVNKHLEDTTPLTDIKVMRAYYASLLSNINYFTPSQASRLHTHSVESIPVTMHRKSTQLERTRLNWIQKYNFPTISEITDTYTSQKDVFKNYTSLEKWLTERTVNQSSPTWKKNYVVVCNQAKSLLNESVQACVSNHKELSVLRDTIDSLISTQNTRRARYRTAYRHLFE